MGITSTLFLICLALLATAAWGLTLRLWPRLAGPGLRALGGRIGLSAAALLTVLLAVAALTNAAFGFYTSWSDLFGATPQSFQLTDGGRVASGVDGAQLHGGKPGGRPGHAGSGSGGPTPASSSSSSPEPGGGNPPRDGQLVTSTLVGLRSGISAQLQVFLPPQYFDPRHPRRYFPAVVVDANADPDTAGLPASLLHSPDRHPAVIVIVNGANGRDIPCSGAQDGQTGELFWGQDLRTAIAARFRVHLNAASWGALSSGPDSDCAAALAVEDAGRYSAAAVLGPWRHRGPHGPGGDPAQWLRSYPPPPSRLLLDGLGQPPTALFGPVRPPLQVVSATGMTEYAAVDWLAQALQNSESA